jgi:hypothetical protein
MVVPVQVSPAVRQLTLAAVVHLRSLREHGLSDNVLKTAECVAPPQAED